MSISYNPWPLGKLPKEFQRPEPAMIKEMGYHWDDPRDIVGIFEEKVARFAGSKYAVAVDCCSNAIFLSLKVLIDSGLLDKGTKIKLPSHTYVSIPMQVVHAGLVPEFEDYEWSGAYQLKPTDVWDAAVRWTKGMYVGGSLMCLSFQIKKRIPICRGGMVLTDDKYVYDQIKLLSYDGRDLTTPYDSPNHIHMIGYHMYMTPEDAARGIILMDNVPEENPDQGGWSNYPNVEQIFNKLWAKH